MDRWSAPTEFVDADDVVADSTVINFTSLDLDTEGNPEHVTPENGDDWAPEDFAS
jgi:hypothetical protein